MEGWEERDKIVKREVSFVVRSREISQMLVVMDYLLKDDPESRMLFANEEKVMVSMEEGGLDASHGLAQEPS